LAKTGLTFFVNFAAAGVDTWLGLWENGGWRGVKMYREYKVEVICESGLSTLVLGAAKLPLAKVERVFNERAREGWQVVFQIVEHRRFLLFWTRESMIVTFGR